MMGLFRFTLLAYLAFMFSTFFTLFIASIIALLWGFWGLRQIDELKTPKGYEEWLQRADEIARKQLKVQ